MTIWYEVYEDTKRGSNTVQTIAFCKYKYTAETVARYFCHSKIRKVMQLNNWSIHVMKTDHCEYDCAKHCTGCDRSFCDIKHENLLPHDEELPESVYMDSGNAYCHSDCLRDST